MCIFMIYVCGLKEYYVEICWHEILPFWKLIKNHMVLPLALLLYRKNRNKQGMDILHLLHACSILKQDWEFLQKMLYIMFLFCISSGCRDSLTCE